MEFFDLARARHSVRTYEPGIPISDDELKQIFNTVVLSPSSFNVQHWQFVVVREPDRKSTLRSMAYGQAQVETASAVVLVCGRLDAHVDAGQIYADAGDEAREKYVPMIEGVYTDQPALQKEEAIRSGSLAAMTFMYAAKAAGWDSGPMIGFDAKKVAQYLELPETTVPVLMIVIGKALNGEQPARGYRRPVSEVVRLERFSGASLD